jgi:AmmeMemoRadiSam system protein B
MDREPAVSGAFYRADARGLSAEVDAFLGSGAPRAPALGVVVPHAGYIYSGAVAGAVYARVEVPSRAVVLCPNHTGLGRARAALWPSGRWRTPLGEVPVDAALCAALARAPGVAPDLDAHRREHALEVQLPFLQRVRPDVAMAPLCLAHLTYRECVALGEALAEAVAAPPGRGAPGPLIVASSDMSHYLPAAAARAADERALAPLLALDPEGLYRTVHDEGITMCGVIPVTVMLVAARALGARTAERIRTAHSGEVNGDDRRVVGYAGVVVRA